MKPDKAQRLTLVHVELAEANRYVAELHRHHDPIQGHRFSLGARNESGQLVGVAIVGRPEARMTDQRQIVEVTRLCSDGTPNVPSFLYGAAARAATALGYKRIQTFILATEPGTTLRAVGWTMEHETDGGEWGRKRRPRKKAKQSGPKTRWGRAL